MAEAFLQVPSQPLLSATPPRHFSESLERFLRSFVRTVVPVQFGEPVPAAVVKTKAGWLSHGRR